MVTTINNKELVMLQSIFNHPQFDMVFDDNFADVLSNLQQKMSKKRVDKKAKLPSFELDGFLFTMAEGNGSVLVIANKEVVSIDRGGGYRLSVSKEDRMDLFVFFYNLLDFYGEKAPVPYHKGYGDSFNVYENEVERTFDFSHTKFSFLCYTDQEDDNWTRISRARVLEVTKMLLSYIFLEEDIEEVLPSLPEDVQNIYPEWLNYKAMKDLQDAKEREEYEERMALFKKR